MGNIVGKQFRVVASKNVTDSLADSVKDGNQAKFYLAQEGAGGGAALDNITKVTDDARNVLIINGNKIQGISNDDVAKLNAITDATKIFTYKGSVATFADLPNGKLRDVSVGDVWNIQHEFTLEDVLYPAYTNVVCASVAYGSVPVIQWDALGGTMQMGTTIASTGEADHGIINYKSPTKVPINSFSIVLGTDTGVVTDSSGIISLRLTSEHFTKLNDNTLYINNNGSPLESVSLDIETSNGLFISSDHLDLRLSTATIVKVSDNILGAASTSSPMKAFSILCQDGIHVKDGDAHSAPSLGLKLSSTAVNSPAKAKQNRGSGLDITTSNELFLALATGSIDNGNYAVNALKKLNTDSSQNINGGLVLDGSALIGWLRLNMTFQSYINSLIDAKLQAQ